MREVWHENSQEAISVVVNKAELSVHRKVGAAIANLPVPLSPIIVGSSDGRKLSGDCLANGDQHASVFCIDPAEPFTHCVVGLRGLDDESSHLDCKHAAFLRRLCD
jgi:hypothetical protein